jgi:hypothetical protein
VATPSPRSLAVVRFGITIRGDVGSGSLRSPS